MSQPTQDDRAAGAGRARRASRPRWPRGSRTRPSRTRRTRRSASRARRWSRAPPPRPSRRRRRAARISACAAVHASSDWTSASSTPREQVARLGRLGLERLLVRRARAALDQRERLHRLGVVRQRVGLRDGDRVGVRTRVCDVRGLPRGRAEDEGAARSLATSARIVAQNSPELSARCVRRASQAWTTTNATSAISPSASSQGVARHRGERRVDAVGVGLHQGVELRQHVRAQHRGRLVEVGRTDREALPVVGAGLLDQPGVGGQPRGRLAEQLGVGRRWTPASCASAVGGGRRSPRRTSRARAGGSRPPTRNALVAVASATTRSLRTSWMPTSWRVSASRAGQRRRLREAGLDAEHTDGEATPATATTPASRMRPGVRLRADRRSAWSRAARRSAAARCRLRWCDRLRHAGSSMCVGSSAGGATSVGRVAGSRRRGPRRPPGPPGAAAAAGPPSVAQRPAGARRAG